MDKVGFSHFYSTASSIMNEILYTKKTVARSSGQLFSS